MKGLKALPHNFAIRWLAVGVWMLVIFLLSHEPAVGSQARSDGIVSVLHALGFGGSADMLSGIVRKSAHFIAYAILGGLIAWALSSRWRHSMRSLAMVCVGLACLYAVSDELHQVSVPGRSGEVRDVALDTAGASLGVGFVVAMLPRRNTA